MALIKCPECGREISDKAVSCPSCGFQMMALTDNSPDEEHHESVIGIVGLIFACLGLFIPFGIIGGILSYIATSKKDKSVCGTIGLIITMINIVVWIILPRV